MPASMKPRGFLELLPDLHEFVGFLVGEGDVVGAQRVHEGVLADGEVAAVSEHHDGVLILLDALTQSPLRPETRAVQR